MGNGQEELWNTLEQIDQLVKDSKSDKSCPVSHKPHNPLGTKPHIRSTPYDGSSSWDHYCAQFDVITELNGWEIRTRAIFLAASLQGPAHATLGDLDATKRTDYEALTDALEARFGSQHRTEMYRAQLHCRVRGREETLTRQYSVLLAKLTQLHLHLSRTRWPGTSLSMHYPTARCGGAFTEPGPNV